MKEKTEDRSDNRERNGWEIPATLGRTRWTLVLGGLLVVVGAIAVFAAGRTGVVPFEPITAAEFTQRLAGLLLVALFIERCLEVFVSGWRDVEERRLRRSVAKARAAGGDAGDGTASGEGEELGGANDALTRYKAETRRIAFVASVLVSIVVAAVGVRVLGMFIDQSAFAELGQGQRSGFHVLDIVLTGGVLAGGSDALHQLMETFTGFLEGSKENVKEKNKS